MKLKEIIDVCTPYRDRNVFRIACPVCENHNFVNVEVDEKENKIICQCNSCNISFVIYPERDDVNNKEEIRKKIQKILYDHSSQIKGCYNNILDLVRILEDIFSRANYDVDIQILGPFIVISKDGSRFILFPTIKYNVDFDDLELYDY